MTQKQYSTYTLFSANTLADKVLMYDISETDPAEKLKLILFSDLLKSLPDGTMLNGKISSTVASNNLTLALKTAGGSDASADDPIWIKINGTWRACTAALSFTLAAATNWFNAGSAELATKEIDYFPYVIWNTTPATDIVDLGASRIPYGTVYSDFSGTSTNEKYLAHANASAPAATDDVLVIGRFAATLSAGAGYTWTVPTYTNTNLIQRPIFETRWLTWVPQLTGFSANPTNTVYRYRLSQNICNFEFGQETDGTSNATTFSATLPFSIVTVTNLTFGGVNFAATDNSAALTGASRHLISTNVITFYTNMTTGAWTGSAGKRAKCQNYFEI